MLVGAFYARYLDTGKIPDDYPASFVKIIWRGIARSAR
jgi:hypothetical protein